MFPIPSANISLLSLANNAAQVRDTQNPTFPPTAALSTAPRAHTPFCEMVDIGVQTEPASEPVLERTLEHKARTGITHSVLGSTVNDDIQISHITELPSEIWGEIATFSLREDVLNLRTVSKELRTQAEVVIPELTLYGSQALTDFAYTPGFLQVKTIRLREVDMHSLGHLVRRLTAFPRMDLSISLSDTYVGISGALQRLSTLPLAEFTLNGVYVTPQLVEAFKDCLFPIAWTGFFALDEFKLLSRIPTLTSLIVESSQFSDEAAVLFSTHPALQTLTLRTNQSFSSIGLEHLAAIPALRSLQLYDTVFMATSINVPAARRLAENRLLENLSIHSRITPLSDACLSALSESVSLKAVAVPMSSGVRHLARTISVEYLELRGTSLESSRMDVPLARTIAGIAQLTSLKLHLVLFDADAFRTLVEGTSVTTLIVANMLMEEDVVNALLSNTHIKVLALVSVRIAPEHIVALCLHPTLERMDVDGVQCALRAAG